MREEPFAEQRPQFIKLKHILIAAFISLSIISGLLINFVEPVYLIAGVVGLIILFLMVKYEYFGLLAYMIVFLIRPGETYPALASVRPEFVLGATLSFLTLLKNKYKYGQFTIPNSRLNVDFLLIIGAMCLSIILSSCKDCTFDTIQEVIKLGILGLLVILTVDTKRRFEIFIWVFLLVMAKMTFDVTWGYYHGEAVFNQGLNRATSGNSLLDNFNGIAITMNTLIPFTYYLTFHYKKLWIKMVSLSLMSLFIWTLILTGSRGGLVGFMAVVGIIWAWSKKKLILGLIIIIMLSAGWLALGSGSRERYSSIISEERDASSENRILAWIDGVQLFIGRPLAGVGAGAFAWARLEKFHVFLNPHNMYVQILAELGLIGIIAYFFFIRDLFKINLFIRRKSRANTGNLPIMEPIARATIISCSSLMISGIFAHSAYRYTWFILAALTVVSERLIIEQQKAENP
jgi:putative inorganic carbon (HCO3(-)) transporter